MKIYNMMATEVCMKCKHYIVLALECAHKRCKYLRERESGGGGRGRERERESGGRGHRERYREDREKERQTEKEREKGTNAIKSNMEC